MRVVLRTPRPYLLAPTTTAAPRCMLRHCSSSSPSRNLGQVPFRRYKSTQVNRTSTSSMWGSAGDMLTALRWKAAEALTQSLNEPERQQLLHKFQPTTTTEGVQNNVLSKHDETSSAATTTTTAATSSSISPPPVSVEEAVAEAVLREQKRLTVVKEEAVARAVAQAEQAAQARIQTEIDIMEHRQQAFAAWQREVDRQTTIDPSRVDSTSTIVREADSTSEQHEEGIHHPILGPCLADLGSKRIHLVTAKALATIPVWNQQRIYRHDRAKAMAADKLKTAHLGMLGVIGLYQDAETGNLSILDGQHRVGMMTILERKHGIELNPVLVEVYTTSSVEGDSNAATAIFEEINKAEPVKLVDMPGMMKASDRKTLNVGVERLVERYPDMFRGSSRCRAPHVNIDNLRDALFAANVLERHQIKTSKGLEEWLLQQNDILKDKYTNDVVAQANISKQALEKARKFDFYLGLDTTWFYN